MHQEWASWSFTACSLTCGPMGGTQTATRVCEDTAGALFEDSVCEEQGGIAEEERV